MPALVIWLMTLSETPDAAAPMMTFALSAISLETLAPAMSGVPSPESA